MVLEQGPASKREPHAAGASLAVSLAALYSDLCTREAASSGDTSPIEQHAIAAQALQAVLAYSSAAKAAALEIGLHQTLLGCISDCHALLALAAFQAPSGALLGSQPLGRSGRVGAGGSRAAILSTASPSSAGKAEPRWEPGAIWPQPLFCGEAMFANRRVSRRLYNFSLLNASHDLVAQISPNPCRHPILFLN